MVQHKEVNEALERFLTLFLFEEEIAKIRARFGDEVTTEVQAIYQEAMNPPVDWSTANIDTALPVIHKLLDSKYPWLSRKARSNLTNAFVMSNK